MCVCVCVCVYACACMCLCVCVCEREREKEGEREAVHRELLLCLEVSNYLVMCGLISGHSIMLFGARCS